MFSQADDLQLSSWPQDALIVVLPVVALLAFAVPVLATFDETVVEEASLSWIWHVED